MALEAARLGHEVFVLTQSEFKKDIELELVSGRVPANLHFDIFMPTWLERLRDIGLKHDLQSLTWQVINVLWQFGVLSHVRRKYRGIDFDLVHHVTIAGIRHPTLLNRLGAPTIIGPLGGGDSVPMPLRKSFPWKEWIMELLRDIYNHALRVDPITRSAFRDATLILLRTRASLVAVPPRYRNKCSIRAGVGISETVQSKVAFRELGQPLQLIYVGNLYYLKGVHLAIRALALAREQGIDSRLTIVGGGAARKDLEGLARKLGIAEQIVFVGQVARSEVLRLYGDHHAFLFSSLRDASPTVIVEAWACGLPVICLALGGPGEMVDSTCGRVVSVSGRTEAECVAGLAAEIAVLATDDRLRLELSRGAIARYRQSSWSTIVAAMYSEIGNRIRHSTVRTSHYASSRMHAS